MAFCLVGGIVSPVLVGVLMSLNLEVQLNFMVIAVARVLGTLSIVLVQEKHAYYNHTEKLSNPEKVS